MLTIEQETEIYSWVGTPYRFRQRVKGQGIDCLQFSFVLFEMLGIDYTSPKAYERSPKGDEFFEWLNTHTSLKRVNSAHPGVGTFVVIETLRDRPYHIIFSLNEQFYIHSNVGTGVVLLPKPTSMSIHSVWGK